MIHNRKHTILILGTGGREDALAWKLSTSSYVLKTYVAPGNGGTDRLKNTHNIDIDINSPQNVVNKSKELGVTFVVVGNDEPLQHGVVDALIKAGIPVYGPSKKAAAIEGSKVFSARFMKRHGILHPKSEVFTRYDKAVKFLTKNKELFKNGVVVKADGLALGKGALVCGSVSEGIDAVRQMMVDKKFGDAGKNIVIQEKLKGYEVSVTVISDGTNYVILPFTEDHKQAFDDDRGPNTGGMGVTCPHPLVKGALIKTIEHEIVKKTLAALKKEGREFRGTLYPGLMIVDNKPYVLEYNARFGDPETESLLPILSKNVDFFNLLYNSAKGKLNKSMILRTKKSSVCVTIASGGYPLKYKKGVRITGLNTKFPDDIFVFHAGTIKTDEGYKTSGGRVLMVTGVANTLDQARKKAYKMIGKKGIYFESMHFRKDIGKRKRL